MGKWVAVTSATTRKVHQKKGDEQKGSLGIMGRRKSDGGWLAGKVTGKEERVVEKRK